MIGKNHLNILESLVKDYIKRLLEKDSAISVKPIDMRYGLCYAGRFCYLRNGSGKILGVQIELNNSKYSFHWSCLSNLAFNFPEYFRKNFHYYN